ncbi:MAG: hypothetical protein JXB62_13675 [Pirellulales bacterium]|nr:hypothetical protein [Pirellulales bacterium]
MPKKTSKPRSEKAAKERPTKADNEAAWNELADWLREHAMTAEELVDWLDKHAMTAEELADWLAKHAMTAEEMAAWLRERFPD